jgi:hypothetical protein
MQYFKLLNFNKVRIRFFVPSYAAVLQLAFQFAYIFIGIYFLRLSKYLDWYLYLLVIGFIADAVLQKHLRKEREYTLNISAPIIVNTIFLFLTGFSFFTYLYALIASLLVKHFISFDRRPVFNPGTFGILFTVFVIGEGTAGNPWVINKYVPFLFIAPYIFGLVTSYFAKRNILSLSYILSFAVIRFILSATIGEPLWIHLATLPSIPMAIFTFHMLTDPRTTPNSNRDQFFFGFAIAALDNILRTFNLSFTAQLALLVISAAIPAYQQFTAKRFNRRSLIPAAALLALVVLGFASGHYSSRDAFDYGQYSNREIQDTSKLMPWKNATERWLKNVPASPGSPHLSFSTPGNALSLDFNNDGYYDLLVINRWPDGKTYLFKNSNGKSFTNATLQIHSTEQFTAGIAFDADNDGWTDLMLTNEVGDVEFFKNKNGEFFMDKTAFEIPVGSRNGFPVAYSVFDFDNDGFLDVFIGTVPFNKITFKDWRQNAYLRGFKNGVANQTQILLKNEGGRTFADISKRIIDSGGAKPVHAVGISDVNNDGYPDVYVAIDFSRDILYINEQGKYLRDSTKSYMGHTFNRNGMSAEFVDINHDGFMDLFVSQMTRGDLNRGMNYFWINQQGKGFVNRSKEYGIDRCASAWGARFVDPDHSGEPDLFVPSGMYKGSSAVPMYYAMLLASVPGFLRFDPRIQKEVPLTSDLTDRTRYCYFTKTKQVFADVAEQVHLEGRMNGAGVAIADLTNSGTEDMIVGSFDHEFQIYSPEKPPKGNWIGFKLVGTNANRDAYGAKVAVRNRGKVEYKELFPNGFHSQNHSRLVFGLSEVVDPQDLQIEVKWPGGGRELYNGLPINRYHRIVQKQNGLAEK